MQPICGAVLAKIEEQIERSEHLMARVPASGIEWRPVADAWSTGMLIGHLMDCLAGVCAVLYAANRERLAHFEKLRAMPVNHACRLDEARTRINLYQLRINEGFELLTDQDLARMIPTVFVPEGEPLMTLLLGNLEHLINHKHQLFTYIKQQGERVSTADLYRIRGAR